MKQILFYCLIVSYLLPVTTYTQPCNELNIQLRSEYPATCNKMAMTMIEDNLGRQYLYVAQKEAGLTIFDVSDISTLKNVASVGISSFSGLHVMSVTQQGTMLYVALGNYFANNHQHTGIAAVDISNPKQPVVTSVYEYPQDGGAGIVVTEGSRVYLGGMGNGLFVFTITNKTLTLAAQYVPDINFPVKTTDSAKYNARGVAVKNGIVYLCYDAGGIRVVDCTNLSSVKEIGQYANRVLDTKPRAYNNIVLDDTLAYVAVDYCGMEVLNIKNPIAITQHSWWNPWTCHTNPLNWFSSAGHANEIQYNKNCKKIFLSTGKSDMYVVDVTNPSHPDSCGIYGGIDNGIGTWGIHMYQNRIYLSYICALIPFASNWTGIKALTYNPCATSSVGYSNESTTFSITPNPATGVLVIASPTLPELQSVELVDVLGKSYSLPYRQQSPTTCIADVSHVQAGMYGIKVIADGYYKTQVVVIE